MRLQIDSVCKVGRELSVKREKDDDGDETLVPEMVRALTAERDRLAKRLAEEERNHEQTLIERDRYAEAISAAHVAAGGDGEWVAKIPPEDLPHSGDLAADVPEMVRALTAERDRLAAELAEARIAAFQAAIDCMTDRQAKDHLAACLQDKFGAWWIPPAGNGSGGPE